MPWLLDHEYFAASASTSGQSTDQHGNAACISRRLPICRDLSLIKYAVSTARMNLQVLPVPLGMPGAGPEVIASVVSYLVKPEAYFITGMPPYVH